MIPNLTCCLILTAGCCLIAWSLLMIIRETRPHEGGPH